jgi:hypothetical protein
MADAARRRFFAARASIAKRDAPVASVQPWGRFTVRIEADKLTTVRTVAHGDLVVENAIIVATSYKIDKSMNVLTDEARVDGAAITIGSDMLENGRHSIDMAEFPLIADIVPTDKGYDVVRLQQPQAMALAA